MRHQIRGQLRGNRAGKCLVCGFRVVARVTQHAHFVFHLHHQHRMFSPIHFLDVMHQRREGACVRFLGSRAQRAQNLYLAATLHHARESPCILLHPDRHVARLSVLPRRQPQKHDALMRLPRLVEEPVDKSEIECAFFGLDQLPAQRRHHGIQSRRRQLRPNRLHVFEIGRRRVVQLAGKHQERLAVNDQLRGRAAFFEMRPGILLRGQPCGAHAEAQKQSQQISVCHNGRSVARAAMRVVGNPPPREKEHRREGRIFLPVPPRLPSSVAGST